MEITLKKDNVVKIVASEQEAAAFINKGFRKLSVTDESDTGGDAGGKPKSMSAKKGKGLHAEGS